MRDAEKREERLHFKFIVEYIKCLHKDTYNKAEELYKNIKHQYPTVKDLTKTAEFMSVATPGKPIPRHYTSRKSNQTQSSMPQTEMVLEIPLMALGQNTSLPVAASPPASPPVSPPVSLPVLPPVSPPVSLPVSLPPVDASPPLLLSKDVYHNLLAELQQDPNLFQILNDYTLGDSSHEDTTIDMDDDIWDSIISDDVTPLEDELERVFNNIY